MMDRRHMSKLFDVWHWEVEEKRKAIAKQGDYEDDFYDDPPRHCMELLAERTERMENAIHTEADYREGINSALHYAVRYPWITARRLGHLLAEEDIRAKTSLNGNTALHCYFYNENPKTEIIKVLLKAKPGPDVNSQNKLGYTPLHCAALCSKLEPEFISVLLEFNANSHIMDDSGCTALDAYLSTSTHINLNIVKLLFPYIKKSGYHKTLQIVLNNYSTIPKIFSKVDEWNHVREVLESQNQRDNGLYKALIVKSEQARKNVTNLKVCVKLLLKHIVLLEADKKFESFKTLDLTDYKSVLGTNYCNIISAHPEKSKLETFIGKCIHEISRMRNDFYQFPWYYGAEVAQNKITLNCQQLKDLSAGNYPIYFDDIIKKIENKIDDMDLAAIENNSEAASHLDEEIL